MHRRFAVLAIFFALAFTASAQTKYPPETKNAALRYWIAFADLQDPPADKALQSLLEKTAAGEAAWDESKLGPILDQNQAAILAMQRATRLPDCDWGLEYSAGWRASIAYAPKARVLARLNALYGIRMQAKGNMQAAVDAWLAGIRFSQHVAEDGPLIFALIAKSTLMPNLGALTRAAQSGALNAAQRKQVEAAISTLPESAFDWSQAMRLEEAGMDSAAAELASSRDPAKLFEQMFGAAAPQDFHVPTASDRDANHKLMLAVEQAYRESPSQAKEKLSALQAQAAAQHVFFQQATPSFTRPNDQRAEIAAARSALLNAVASRP